LLLEIKTETTKKMTPEISILIVNYNTTKYLKQGLELLYKNINDGAFEVIVVDNNSKDGIDETMILFPQVIVIKNKKNEGFAFAQNQAFALAKGKYVIAFNPDAEISQEQLKQITDYLNNNPNVGLLAPLIRDSNGCISIPYHTFPIINTLQFIRILKRNRTPPPIKNPLNVKWIWGTGLVVRKQLFDKKLFDEHSFLFWEEFNLAKDIRKKGFEIIIHPDIIITHHTSVSFKFNQTKLSIARNLSAAHGYRIRKKHYGIIFAKINSLINLFDNLFLFLLLKLKSLFSKKNEKRLLMTATYKAEFIGNLKIFLLGDNYTEIMEKKARMNFK
jgi:N-acetylglucosaminyl-diphospho-decaprenol L-rhamnosyltransferase